MKNKLAKNSLAVGVVTLVITAGLSFSANGADKTVAQSEASAITATGLTQIVDSKVCNASSTGPAAAGTGICGEGLTVSKPAVSSFDQTASTGLDGNKGTSKANAQVAGTGIAALTTIDLSKVPAELTGIKTGTVLDPIVSGLGAALTTLLTTLGLPLQTLLDSIQNSVIAPLTTALQKAIPVSVNVGAVSSECTAVPGSASGSTKVAGINIVADLGGGNTLTVPVALSTSKNAALVGSIAPKELVDGLLKGLQDTLTISLTGALKPIAALLGNVQTVVDKILAQVGPALLDPVGKALTPILTGTVNKETKTAGAVEETALSLNVLSKTATLDLARTKCGPNSSLVVDSVQDQAAAAADDSDQAAAAADDSDTPTDADAAADADAQADADVTTTLPGTGAPNLTPFWLLGLGLLLFGATVLINEKRRFGKQ
jgi:hypothetical protein